MAIKSTIFKASLQVSDIDRSYYETHALTIARHPSETDERMMLRVLAFGLHAHERLAFGGGLSTDDEPSLWLKDLTGAIDLWIDVGLPDAKLVRRACGRAAAVVVYPYGGRAADLWWEKSQGDLVRQTNLSVKAIPQEASRAAAGLAQRTMNLQLMVQDGQIWLSDDAERIEVVPRVLKAGAA